MRNFIAILVVLFGASVAYAGGHCRNNVVVQRVVEVPVEYVEYVEVPQLRVQKVVVQRQKVVVQQQNNHHVQQSRQRVLQSRSSSVRVERSFSRTRN